jgi:hypothetical protein
MTKTPQLCTTIYKHKKKNARSLVLYFDVHYICIFNFSLFYIYRYYFTKNNKETNEHLARNLQFKLLLTYKREIISN